MKKLITLLVLCLLPALHSMAVLKEKDLARTLGVLKAELRADFEKQQQFLERYQAQSEAQHKQLVSYMQKCEQIGLMLYSQKSDYTFDMAYACQQATDLHRNLHKNNLPYNQIKERVEQEIERYTELIRSLKQLPPIAEDDKDEVMTRADSILLNAIDSLKEEAMEVTDDTLSEAIAKELSPVVVDEETVEEDLGPFVLTKEQQEDRKECLEYAEQMKEYMEQFLESLTNENIYYTSVSEKAQELNDFAQSRYKILQNSIFQDGGKNYFAILANLPRYVKMASNDVRSKYLPFADHEEGYSEWRGMHVAFISIFMLIYMAIAALVSTLIIRVLMPKRFRTEQFRQKRSMLNAALGIFIFAVCVMIARTFIDRNFVLMGTSLMILLAWMLLAIFVSFLIRLDGEQVKHAVRIYLPFIVMAFIVILFRIVLIPNNVVNLIYPPILLFFTWWQVRTIQQDKSLLPKSDVLYSNISAIAMVVACIASWVGYTLLAVEVMVWWMFQLAAIQTVTCVYDLMQGYEVNTLAPRLHCSPEQMKDGEFITKTWFYDLMRITLLPIMAVFSVLLSIYWAADIFEMTSVCFDIFRYKFIDQPNLLQLSLSQLCLVAALFFVFRYFNYAGHSFYRHLRKNYFTGAENSYNRTLANNVIGILVWGLYFIIVLTMLHIPASGISIVTAGLATGLGFAMKDLLENFFYGISLMTGRIRVGDYIECDGIQGKVESISYQSTQLVTADGCVIAFLNSALFNKNFKNMTRNHRYELIKIPIGVAYGSNVEEVRKMLVEAVTPLCHQKNKEGQWITDPKTQPSVAFSGFGDSSVDLLVCVWMLVEEKIGLTGRVKETIYNTLNDNHIEIPFPQTDVHLIR